MPFDLSHLSVLVTTDGQLATHFKSAVDFYFGAKTRLPLANLIVQLKAHAQSLIRENRAILLRGLQEQIDKKDRAIMWILEKLQEADILRKKSN